MPRLNELFFFLLILSISNASSYGKLNVLIRDCNNRNDSTNYKLSKVDTYIYLIGSPIAFFTSLFITITFIIYPKTQRMPGDFIFFISLSDCLLCAHWFSQAVYVLKYDASPSTDGWFCIANSFVSIFGASGEFSYNVIFCFYIILSLKNPLAPLRWKKILLHLIVLTLMIGLPIFAYYDNLFGLNMYGSCSLKDNQSFPVTGFVIIIIYVSISCYTIYKFKQSIPDQNYGYVQEVEESVTQRESLIKPKKSFTFYYYKFIIASTIIWTSLAICNFITAFNCLYFGIKQLYWFITIGNSLKLLTPFVLSMLRYQHPTIKRKVKRLFSVIFRLKQQDIMDESINSLEQTLINRKLYYLKSIIYGLGQVYNFDQGGDYKPSASYKDLDQEVSRLINIKDLQTSASNIDLPIRLIAYSENIFQKILQKDINTLNPVESLDLELNKEQINNLMGPEGGKSGEFIFSTYDNKLIIKTIQQDELDALRSKLNFYYQHLLHNQSLISPIYGLFTFVNQEDNSQKTNIVVMKNICQVDRKYIMRVYDVKGSDYERFVLKNYENVPQVIQKTLLDIDFKNLEGQLKIKPEKVEIVKGALEQDAMFLGSANLMDYSLLIVKINWKAYLEDTQLSNQYLQYNKKPNQNEIYRLECISEEGVYYHIGIIDYLQEWNSRKFIERQGKLFINGQQANISVLQPEQYSKRFIENVVNKIF